jgi:hypothetical protein
LLDLLHTEALQQSREWVEKREVKSIPGFLRGVGKLTDIPCSQPDS